MNLCFNIRLQHNIKNNWNRWALLNNFFLVQMRARCILKICYQISQPCGSHLWKWRTHVCFPQIFEARNWWSQSKGHTCTRSSHQIRWLESTHTTRMEVIKIQEEWSSGAYFDQFNSLDDFLTWWMEVCSDITLIRVIFAVGLKSVTILINRRRWLCHLGLLKTNDQYQSD